MYGASQLTPGMTFPMSGDKKDKPSFIRTINELCLERPTPHVHIVTNNGTKCLNFTH